MPSLGSYPLLQLLVYKKGKASGGCNGTNQDEEIEIKLNTESNTPEEGIMKGVGLSYSSKAKGRALGVQSTGHTGIESPPLRSFDLPSGFYLAGPSNYSSVGH
ncbi:hypothetical protein K1719_005930 [Acacia pycnantha]|nr:hypothetical protein K1719_005930 [Acacia pycnantha]